VSTAAAWKEARRRGIDGDLCDRIVAEREPPTALLAAIFGDGPIRMQGEPFFGEREKEVLQLLACGRTEQTIAAALGTSIYTVKTQLKTVKRKLGARSTPQMVALAWRKGLIA
jgi:DNA-binding NarL/FixJ family response regulator